MKRKFKLSAEAEEIVKDEMKHLTREDLLLAVVNVERVIKKNGGHRGFQYTLHLKDNAENNYNRIWKDGIVIRKCATTVYANAYYSDDNSDSFPDRCFKWSFGKNYQKYYGKLIKEIPVTRKPCVIEYEARM